MHLFVTGIDTDSGKTVVSAILCKALRADYWKPVQAGQPRDAETVRMLVNDPTLRIHPEKYILSTPVSPHAAARADGKSISLDDFELPRTGNSVVIEGAGGCLVPLNGKDLMIDLILRFKAPVVVVADLYLGSINHTLLTVEALQCRNIEIRGIVFNGPRNADSEHIILDRSGVPCLLRIDKEPAIGPQTIEKYATMIRSNWNG